MSMGCVLGKHDDTGIKEWAIYYLSKTLDFELFFFSNQKNHRLGLVWSGKPLEPGLNY